MRSPETRSGTTGRSPSGSGRHFPNTDGLQAGATSRSWCSTHHPAPDRIGATIGNAAEERNKAFVLEAFDTLANRRDFAAAHRFWSPDYIQHSAHIPPGRDGLFNLVKASPLDRRYENALAIANGDYVMLHGRLSSSGLQTNRSPWTSCGWKTG
jgi:predicted SnoaL-like aldol condensation-catalyzing enzyme